MDDVGNHPDVRTNRANLPRDLLWLTGIARRLPRGHVEVAEFIGQTKQHKKVKRYSAVLMHDAEGIALSGIGKSPSEAVFELRQAVERELARAERQAERDA